MSKIKDQFNSMRENTPKGVMWLLLVAGFIIVLILLTLIFIRSDKHEDVPNVVPDEPIFLEIFPESIEWRDVETGSKQREKIKVSATAPIKVIQTRLTKEIAGLSVTSTCPKLSVGPDLSCMITVEYTPVAAMSNTNVPLYVDWYGINETPDMVKSAIISITVGATAPAPQVLPAPEPEPVYIPEPVFEPEPIIEQQVIQAVEDVAPALPEIVIDDQPKISEACSDFAIPGYDLSGNQFGWIKPEAGTYYFHPFADKNCDDPTGIYNPDNGIIVDIKSNGKKIGSDAEHIGYSSISNGTMPQLNSVPGHNVPTSGTSSRRVGGMGRASGDGKGFTWRKKQSDVVVGTSDEHYLDSTQPYDRTFVLRQYKPIPATIVSEVRADQSLYGEDAKPLPVRATVDRNIYSDNGRTVILPAGTLLLGYVTGEIPGPYRSIGRMQIQWYQFIRPDGVEFNFDSADAYSADSQGRAGVPGHGSTDYVEQIVMPLLTAMVPAAVNLIAPIADTFVNQIDLDNNTVVQSGKVRSSELAKDQVITAWNQVAQKLLVDALDNTVPPFSIAAGTRITVYSPIDLRVVCPDETKKCYVGKDMESTGNQTSGFLDHFNASGVKTNYRDPSWVGQVRSFNIKNCCTDDGKVISNWYDSPVCKDYDYNTLLFSCQANQYQAINNAKQAALYQNQQSVTNTNSVASTGGPGTQAYNEQVLGLKYNDDGSIQNPFNAPKTDNAQAQVQNVITCEDGTLPDSYGCCTGEIYTDMGDQGFNCCPTSGGDCFPPIK